mmetsp:Transcript_7857/g.22582  ORF Transcript_7857/g.22582 Transcript_7857/m.22582 type:complete len:489 (+) Transcript_7857:2-1468(+)
MGPWGLTESGAQSWFAMASEADFKWNLWRKRLSKGKVRESPQYCFGAHLNQRNYALPCTDLRWDGRSWTGRWSPSRWQGLGGAVMEFVKRAVKRRIGEDVAPAELSLSCTLTPDDPAEPRELVWQVLAARGGRAIIELVLQPCAGLDSDKVEAVALSRRSMRPEQVLSGPYIPLEPTEGEWHPWLGFMADKGMTLYLARRRLGVGASGRRSLVFGAQADADNYAFPCVDMEREGFTWTGKVSRGAWKGTGGTVMAFLWEDFDRLLGGVADDDGLRCVLELNAAGGEWEATWSVDGTDGRAISIRLRTEVDDTHVSIVDGVVSSDDLSGAFACLRSLGPWQPSTVRAWARHPWLAIASTLNFTLNFRRQHVGKLVAGAPTLYTFGASADEANFALPCADLVWDGRSWSGEARRELAIGTGVKVMASFWEDLHQRLDAKESDVAPLVCIFTADDAEDPQQVIWQVVNARGRALMSLPLRRSAPRERGAEE